MSYLQPVDETGLLGLGEAGRLKLGIGFVLDDFATPES
jgi:hypothetical protein